MLEYLTENFDEFKEIEYNHIDVKNAIREDQEEFSENAMT